MYPPLMTETSNDSPVKEAGSSTVSVASSCRRTSESLESLSTIALNSVTRHEALLNAISKGFDAALSEFKLSNASERDKDFIWHLQSKGLGDVILMAKGFRWECGRAAEAMADYMLRFPKDRF